MLVKVANNQQYINWCNESIIVDVQWFDRVLPVCTRDQACSEVDIGKIVESIYQLD